MFTPSYLSDTYTIKIDSFSGELTADCFVEEYFEEEVDGNFYGSAYTSRQLSWELISVKDSEGNLITEENCEEKCDGCWDDIVLAIYNELVYDLSSLYNDNWEY